MGAGSPPSNARLRGDHVVPAAFAGGDGDRLFPAAGHAGFAAGVGELRTRDGAVLAEKFGDAGESGDVVVGPDAEVAGGDAGFGADGGCFGHDHPRSTYSSAAEVD